MSAYPYSATVARRVAELRRQRGWSAQRLADEMTEAGQHVSRSTLANLENGRRDRITVDELYAFATVLGVPADRLAHDRPSCPTCSDQPPTGFTCRSCGAAT